MAQVSYYIWRPDDGAVAEPVMERDGKLSCPSMINPDRDWLVKRGSLEPSSPDNPEFHLVVYEYSLYAAENLGYRYFVAGLWRLFSILEPGEELLISRRDSKFSVWLSSQTKHRDWEVDVESLTNPLKDAHISWLLEDLFTFVREGKELIPKGT